MKQINKFMLFFTLSTAVFIHAIEDFSLTAKAFISNDAQALDYCKFHKNTYVVIVWPKGFNALGYITAQFNEYATVKYVKRMIFKKKSIFLLYRSLHPTMSYKSAKKHFKPYLSSLQKKVQPMAALIIETDVPLEILLKWKREIRCHIGQRFYSIHINDYYWPETVEAAQAVFCDFKALDLTN